MRCPVCDDQHVERRPSARVHVRKGARPAVDAPRAGRRAAGSDRRLPADLVAKLREIVRNTEDVGERFPDEARKIHYDEAPDARDPRQGVAARKREALTDEGIEFSPLPPFLTRDTPLDGGSS